MSPKRTNPGPLLEATIELFPQFIVPEGKILLTMDRLGRRRKAAKTQSAEFASVERNELPMLAILDESLDHMFLVDVLSTQGFMNQKRIEFLERLCSHRRRVTICLAIWSRSDLMFMEELPWGSFIWCASEPRHLIHFDPCRK